MNIKGTDSDSCFQPRRAVWNARPDGKPKTSADYGRLPAVPRLGTAVHTSTALFDALRA